MLNTVSVILKSTLICKISPGNTLIFHFCSSLPIYIYICILFFYYFFFPVALSFSVVRYKNCFSLGCFILRVLYPWSSWYVKALCYFPMDGLLLLSWVRATLRVLEFGDILLFLYADMNCYLYPGTRPISQLGHFFDAVSLF